jgi:hypothetical protein
LTDLMTFDIGATGETQVRGFERGSESRCNECISNYLTPM